MRRVVFGPARLRNPLEALDPIALCVGAQRRIGNIIHVALQVPACGHSQPKDLDPTRALCLGQRRALGNPNSGDPINKGRQAFCRILLGGKVWEKSLTSMKTPCPPGG